MTDPSDPPPPIIPPEGDDEWQIIDGTPSNIYRSINNNESESDNNNNNNNNNAAIESAAMAAADDNPPSSLPLPPSIIQQRKIKQLSEASLSATLSSSSSFNNNNNETNTNNENNNNNNNNNYLNKGGEEKEKEKEKENEEELHHDKICRICQDGDDRNDFISPCRCKGSMKYVHSQCLEKWRNMSANPKSFFECDQCKYKYHFSRTRAGEILASKWALNLLTIIAMFLLIILLGYVLKLFNIIIPISFYSNNDDIIVEVNERGDIIIKNTTDLSSSSSSSDLSFFSRIYQFLRIDIYHILYGTICLGFGGFFSLIRVGGGLYHFGGGWRSSGRGSNDRAINALEMIILTIIVIIGLVKASFSVYEMVEKKVNQGLLSARNMVINIPEGE